jgi:hypothetical protein
MVEVQGRVVGRIVSVIAMLRQQRYFAQTSAWRKKNAESHLTPHLVYYRVR